MQSSAQLIKEDAPKYIYIKHDQLHKELIRTFFKEFLRMMTRMELEPAKQRIVYGFFEVPISYEEKGKEIGKKEGEASALRQVAIEMLKEGLSEDPISKLTHLRVRKSRN